MEGREGSRERGRKGRRVKRKSGCNFCGRRGRRSVGLALGQVLNHRAGERKGLVENVLRKWWLVPSCLLTTILKGPTYLQNAFVH